MKTILQQEDEKSEKPVLPDIAYDDPNALKCCTCQGLRQDILSNENNNNKNLGVQNGLVLSTHL